MEKISKIIIFGLLIAMSPYIASAGSLSLNPSSSEVRAGSIFTVTVVANSDDKAMNAASGVIAFDPSILEATGISRTGSIITLWAEEPTRSNRDGTISFEGILLSPGFTGKNGKLFTISFKARKEGSTKLSFTSGSLLANDGTGGNILSSMNPLTLSIYDSESQEATSQKTAPSSLPAENASDSGIVIRSTSHPDASKWYSDNTPDLSWTIPSETTEIKTLINKSDSRAPNVSYIPPIFEKTIDSLADGKYYFSLQAKTPKGWSSVERRAVNIDTIPPHAFSVGIANETRDRHLPPAITFSTTDSISDNLRYEVKVGDGEVLKTEEHKSGNPFLLPSQNPGAYVVTVSAYDEADNVRTETVGFIIEAIATPKLVSFPSEVKAGSKEEIKGITYPNATITFYYRSGEKIAVEETIKSNEKGDFVMPVTSKLESGVYILTVRVIDQNGARSNETSPIIISFKPLYATLSFIVYSLIFIIVVISVGTAVFMWRRSEKTSRKNRTKAKAVSREAEHITERSFEILREDIANRIGELKAMRPKRKFVDREISFLEELESNLLEARVVIVDDIHKISDIEADY